MRHAHRRHRGVPSTLRPCAAGICIAFSFLDGDTEQGRRLDWCAGERQSMFHPSPRSIRALTHHSPLRPSPLHRSPLRPSPRFAHHHFIAASLPRHLIRCPTRPKALRAGGFNGYAIDADPHPSTGMGRWLPEENEANMRTELADPGRFEFLKNCNIVIV